MKRYCYHCTKLAQAAEYTPPKSAPHTTFPPVGTCSHHGSYALLSEPFLFFSLLWEAQRKLSSGVLLFCGGTRTARPRSGRVRQCSIRSAYFENTLRFSLPLYDAEGAFLRIFYFIKFKQNGGGKCWPAHHRTRMFVTDKGLRTHRGSGPHMCPGGQHTTICDSVILSFLWLSLTCSKNQ